MKEFLIKDCLERFKDITFYSKYKGTFELKEGSINSNSSLLALNVIMNSNHPLSEWVAINSYLNTINNIQWFKTDKENEYQMAYWVLNRDLDEVHLWLSTCIDGHFTDNKNYWNMTFEEFIKQELTQVKK